MLVRLYVLSVLALLLSVICRFVYRFFICFACLYVSFSLSISLVFIELLYIAFLFNSSIWWSQLSVFLSVCLFFCLFLILYSIFLSNDLNCISVYLFSVCVFGILSTLALLLYPPHHYHHQCLSRKAGILFIQSHIDLPPPSTITTNMCNICAAISLRE